MKPHAARTAQLSRIAAIASGLMLAIPAAAQQERMPGMSQMPEMQMPAPKPKKRMDMSPKPRTPPRAHQPAGPAAPAAPSSGSRAMGGMTMPSTRGGPTPMQPPAPVDLQHLDFGNMIGARPRPGGLAESSPGMEMSSMPTMSMSSRGSAPPDARSPDYSDGYRYTNMPGMDMVDHAKVGMLLINQLEYARDNHGGNAAFLDAEGWYGEDFNKLWLKAEGEAGRGKLEDLRTEALWNHAISTYWGTQLGVRQDFGEGPRRTWAAFGVEGLAPLWFETEAALYIAPGGRTAARVQLAYEVLLSQRLILQPKVEVNLYGKDDPQRGIGSGLSDSELGVRLRYDIEREFGPYIGVIWREFYGRTATLAHAQGGRAGELQLAAGVRVWF